MSTEDTTASPAGENLEALDVSTTEATQDANTAQSSSADTTDAKQAAPEDLDSVIRKAVEKEPEAKEDSSTPEADGNADGLERGDGSEDPNAAADPDAEVPFHKHPRWQEMKAERDSFKAAADNYRKITDFMTQTNLTGDEVAVGFEIMALLKSQDQGNLQKARDWFAERLTALDETLGNHLPDDLRTKVNEGLVDEEVAKELARERARARNLENLRTQEETRTQQARQEEAIRDVQFRTANVVQNWENDIKAKDPDYSAKKAKLVETQVRALIQQRGQAPGAPEEAVELVKQAYAEVNEMLKPLMPKPRPITPSPTGMSARVSTEPRSFADAIRAAVNR